MRNINPFSNIAVASAALLLSVNAHALLLQPPGNGSSNETSASQEESELISALGLGGVDLDLLYKADFDTGDEEGAFETSYSTSWILDGENEATGADITWDGVLAAITCPSCYVAVKDGNNTPGFYFFDISNLWNGTDPLEFRNFWPDNGAISHISIYGKEMTVQVPEPGTMGLLGLGILGLMTVRRKIHKST
ncbi:PEP-CTERM sorting domain-containing protein [Marinobacter guineae]|uniref:PEP-CTERM sorting domain-containing protein n=1 Tax=Marinobacter guineae TaxID=432303 RepID=A0A2G1VFP5_9GAMM|nr:PEP-CTERM sorting domain-containing protein [Marinobacter guineae]PHQ25593.1 PEP-CTERM sorting domain-containing protein [Marinobacter guineae]